MDSVVRVLGMTVARVAVFGAEKWHAYDDTLNGPACGAAPGGGELVEAAFDTVRTRLAGDRCRRPACALRWPAPLRLVS